MHRYLTALATLLVASVGFAQQDPDLPTIRPEIRPKPLLINDVDQSTVASHAATPFLEPSSFGVIDIDITKIDVANSSAMFLPMLRVPAGDETAQVVAMVTGFVESLKTAGVEHIYVTGSTRSITDGGLLAIIPCENTAVVKGLASVLLQSVSPKPAKEVHAGEKLVLVGTKVAVDRVLADEGAERADLILPLKDAKRLDHAVVISLPGEAHDELVALWPDKLPANAPVQFSPRSVAEDVHRIIVSFQLPPEPQVQARIETTGAGAANRVKETLGKILALSPEAKDAVKVTIDVANVNLDASPDALAKVVAKVTAPLRAQADHTITVNSLKQVGLAMHNYYAVNEHLPPRCLTDKQGKPLLSWRVTVLPYLEQRALHDKIKLDQPFSSDANKEAVAMSIPTLCENQDQHTKSRIRVPVFPGSLWQGEGPPKSFRDVIDGTSNTIAAIHAPADAAVDWADPQPWVLSPDDPMSDIFGDRDDVAILLLDGSARVYKKDELNNDKLKAMLTFAGREVIER